MTEIDSKRFYIGLIPIREGLSEMKTVHFWRDLAIESLASFILLYTSCLAVIPTKDGQTPNMFRVAATIGIYVFVLIETFGHLQWASMNPAAVLAFVFTKRISIFKGFFLVIVEIFGGAGGAALAIYCAPEKFQTFLQEIAPNKDLSLSQAICTEVMITGILVFVVLGSLDDTNRKTTVPGLVIGLCITAGISIGNPLSGGCMNPSFAFSVSLVTNSWKHPMVYWIGDICGALLAITFYCFFIYDKGYFAHPERTENSYPEREDHNANGRARKGDEKMPLKEETFA